MAGAHGASAGGGPGPGPGKEAPPLGRYSWALFDWANQPFFTLITTFIFAPYFANVLVGDPVKGQAQWAFTQATSGVIIALCSPFLGSMADAAGRRKPYILAFQIVLATGCFALWWAVPGRPDLVAVVAWAVVLATVGAEISIVFNNAQLPNIVGPDKIGRLSGIGWGLGYCGGLLSLFIVLAVRDPAMLGLAPAGSPPLFGLDRATYDVERLIGPATVLWMALFALPMFLFTPDGRATGLSVGAAARRGASSLLATVKALRGYRNAARFLVAFMIYNDGLTAVIAFGGVYAAATFGWTTTTLGVFGIILTVFATFGAFTGGRLDDAIGSKRTIQIAIVGVFIATLGILSVTDHSILFAVETPRPAADRGMFGSPQEKVFMGFALILGICMGPMQAASRTMVGRLAPEGMTGEFYGLFALSGRATAFMAPLLIGVVTQVTDSNRGGLMVVLVFLAVGFAILWTVREERAPRLH
ncbi:MAG: MFS transporter [Rhodospirillales bacterium]|nr:MAG: MFS transporter [Rhodospirillales bacterium]